MISCPLSVSQVKPWASKLGIQVDCIKLHKHYDHSKTKFDWLDSVRATRRAKLIGDVHLSLLGQKFSLFS